MEKRLAVCSPRTLQKIRVVCRATNKVAKTHQHASVRLIHRSERPDCTLHKPVFIPSVLQCVPWELEGDLDEGLAIVPVRKTSLKSDRNVSRGLKGQFVFHLLAKFSPDQDIARRLPGAVVTTEENIGLWSVHFDGDRVTAGRVGIVGCEGDVVEERIAMVRHSRLRN